jgi:hypothetical protein
VSRRLRWLLLAVCLLLLAGCQTEAFVEVQVDADGGGAVYVALAMDQEAATRTVLYERQLPIDDLVATGWTVSGPAQEADGRIWLRAQKEFSQLEQIPPLIEEVVGKGGPLQNFSVQPSSSFGKRSWDFTGTVDLRGGLASFTDPELAELLGGEPLGQSPTKFQEALGGATLESLVKVNVVVDLPGEVKSSNGNVGKAGIAAPTTTTTARAEATDTSVSEPATSTSAAREPDRGAAVVWNPGFADGSPTQLELTSSSTRLMPRLWRWLGLLAGVVGLAAFVYQASQVFIDRARDRRRMPTRGVTSAPEEPQPIPVGRFAPTPLARRGGPPRDPTDPGPRAPAAPSGRLATVGGPVPEPADGQPLVATGGPAGAGASPPGPEPGPLRLIVLETTGALLAGRDPIGDELVPFARERGCVLSVRQVADLYLARAVGGMSSADFWSGLGLAGDPMLLDDVYARRFELTDQVLAFLTQANQRGVAVAAVGDDVPEWTAVFRQRFRLDGLIGTWVSSAEVGVRVPHPALLEAVERATGYPPRASMVIGASRSLLDAARRLGYRTIQYNPGPDDPESDHPVLRTFADRGRPAEGTPAA